MAEDWREKLKGLHDQLSRGQSPSTRVPPTATPTKHSSHAAAPAVDIHLGIDFGTRFTKVAACLPHLDLRQVLAFKGHRLLPSRVVLGTDGKIYFINRSCGPAKLALDYLKIRLANPAAEAFGTTMLVDGVPFAEAVAPLSAFYLAAVLSLSKAAASKAFAKEIGDDRPVNWRANVGVPVKHYDSDVLEVFRRMVAVAWVWQDRQPFNPTTRELVAQYESALDGTNHRDLPIQVIPELSAALVHFAEHRNRPEGYYGFLDIGGGTLDGSVFELQRDIEGPRVRILAADVAELGTMAIARHIVANAHLNMVELIEKPLILDSGSPRIGLPVPQEVETRVQSLFASVMATARGKMNIREEESTRPSLNRPKPTNIPVYLAGGGAHSEWYRQLFSRLHQDFNHASAWGIGGYELDIIPPPRGLQDADYPRFVVAFGLTTDAIRFERYKLPSGIQPAPGPTPREPSVPKYEDTKSLM